MTQAEADDMTTAEADPMVVSARPPAPRSRWSVRLGAVATAVVALGSAVLSWDAQSWGAGQLGVDARLTWLYPVVIDGTIVVGTVTALALRRSPYRIRAYVWALLAGAVGVSVVGNAAHAAAGSVIHVVGAAVPAVALAASPHLLVILVRHAPGGTQAPPATGDGSRVTAEGEPPERRNPQARVGARAEARRLLRRQRGPLAEGAVRRLAERVAERTGVSIPHARRLVREEARVGSNAGVEATLALPSGSTREVIG